MNTPARDPRQQQANLRLALILVSVAVALALGFVAKIWLFSR
jgi:hypothetical protein